MSSPSAHNPLSFHARVGTDFLDLFCQTTKARASTLTLPHGPVPLPIFMPVATQASLKGLTPSQLAQTGCKLCLNNTYHLGLKPGQETLKKVGGAHALQGWKGNILTDSGGCELPLLPNSLYSLTIFLAPTYVMFSLVEKFPNGEPPATRPSHRRRRPLPQPSRRLSNAPNARTFHLSAEYHRQ